MRAAARRFSDRRAAGVELARELRQHALESPLLVLGLPRGGVPVAAEVARALQAPLDVLIVRKIGLPRQPELAIGAIASGNLIVREPHAALHGLSEEVFERLAALERAELERRERLYRAGRPPLYLHGQTVLLVDDGLATGATMLVAVRAVRQGGAAKVIVTAPVASHQAVDLLAHEADSVIILRTPPALFAIGEWYEDFAQLDDGTVCHLLEQQRATPEGATDAPQP